MNDRMPGAPRLPRDFPQAQPRSLFGPVAALVIIFVVLMMLAGWGTVDLIYRAFGWTQC